MNRDPVGEFYLLWNESYASCCTLPSVKIKLPFSGMNNGEVFYYHIEDCSGNKIRHKNIKKKKEKAETKTNSDTSNPERIVLIKKLKKADVLNFSCSLLICFRISLFVLPPPPPPPFIYFALLFLILTCLQFSLLLWWKRALASCKLPSSLAMTNAVAPSQSSAYARHFCRWECNFCASANSQTGCYITVVWRQLRRASWGLPVCFVVQLSDPQDKRWLCICFVCGLSRGRTEYVPYEANLPFQNCLQDILTFYVLFFFFFLVA